MLAQTLFWGFVASVFPTGRPMTARRLSLPTQLIHRAAQRVPAVQMKLHKHVCSLRHTHNTATCTMDLPLQAWAAVASSVSSMAPHGCVASAACHHEERVSRCPSIHLLSLQLLQPPNAAWPWLTTHPWLAPLGYVTRMPAPMRDSSPACRIAPRTQFASHALNCFTTAPLVWHMLCPWRLACRPTPAFSMPPTVHFDHQQHLLDCFWCLLSFLAAPTPRL